MITVIRKEDIAAREEMLQKIKSRSIALDRDLLARVAEIIDDVRSRGDEALIDYANRFDGIALRPGELKLEATALTESASRVDDEVRKALQQSIANVRAFHERQIEASWEFNPNSDVTLGQLVRPIERAGVYVPGGTAAYPSSLIMNVVPAQIAGVERIVVATPPRTVFENPAIAAAIVELNLTEVYQVGGAQAIAALAFGTETVPRVDKITGPGNKYVAAAKKLVFGTVGIDSIAGPTEVVIIADETARADFVAADLLAQAEHDEQASALLITNSESLALSVQTEIDRQIENLSRRSIIEQSLNQFGAAIVVENLDDACAIANDLAPEHLEAYEALFQYHLRGGRASKAEQAAEQLLEHFPDHGPTLITLGDLRFDTTLRTAEDVDLWIRLLLRSGVYLTSAPLATSVLLPASSLSNATSALRRAAIWVGALNGAMIWSSE